MEHNIIRHYPTKKNGEIYPLRYSKYVFDEFNVMNENDKLQTDYKKWKDGMNYLTNRQITIGGKIHIKLKSKFIIYYTHYYSKTHLTHQSVLFENLSDIDSQHYLQLTDTINNEIDTKNSIITKYNELIDSIIGKIQMLKSWDSFIEFEGKQYGIANKVINNIHMENDCFGSMIYYTEQQYECKGCRDGTVCNGSYSCSCIKYAINKCSKCGFIEDNP